MGEKIWTGPFIIAVLNNFFLFVVYYCLLTSLPVYVLNELNGTEGQAGLVIAIFMLSAILIRPFSGRITEVLGKRKTLIISQLFFCISSVLYIFIDSIELLYGLRFFHGIWFSFVTTALMTIVNDLIPESRKGAGLGYFAMSSNLAVVFGPFIALTTIQWVSFHLLFIGLSVAVIIGYIFAFNLKVTEYQQDTAVERRFLSWGDLFEKKAIPIAIVACLTAFSYTSIMSYISVYAESKALFEYVSLFFVVFAIAMIVARPFTGRLYDTKGPSIVIFPSFVLFAMGLFLLSVLDSVAILFISAVLVGIGYGSIVPCFQALAIQSAEKHRSAHATSTFWTCFDGGIAVGASTLGVVLALWNYSTMYLLCGGVIVASIFLYSILVSGNKKKKREVHV